MGASLEQGLELINPGPAVAVNTTNQLGGGLKLSFPLLCFPSAFVNFLFLLSQPERKHTHSHFLSSLLRHFVVARFCLPGLVFSVNLLISHLNCV